MRYEIRVLAMSAALALLGSSANLLPTNVFAAQDGLRINEICTQNKNTLLDSYGNASDWIELYNSSDSTVDLSGWTIKDSKNPWEFPQGAEIGAGEYLLIYASKEQSTDEEFHTGFGLSKSGDSLTLTNASGTVVQQVTIPALSEDSTYGIVPDSGEWAVMQPSPRSENFYAVSAPEFSLPSGFYDESEVHTLTLSASGDIYFTTDGSDPTTSATAQKYSEMITLGNRSAEENSLSKIQYESNSTQSITLKTNYRAPGYKVEKGNVIRAAAKSGNSWSNVVSSTYFVLPSDRIDYYRNIKVVSLVTDPDNLTNKDTGIYVAGQQHLDWKAGLFPDIPYNPNKSEWDSDNIANFFSRGKEWERDAQITLFENGVQEFTQDFGIRIKGASTRNAAHKSFNIYARGEYGDSKLNYELIEDNPTSDDGKQIKTYDSFTLRAISYKDKLRDHFVQNPLRDLEEMPTLDRDKCVVFIDGEYWGFYDISERYSSYYFQSNYGVPEEDVVYLKDGELEEGTDSDKDEYDNVIWYAKSNDMSDPDNYAYFTDRADVTSFIDHFAVCLYTGMWDWPDHNYVAWRYNGNPIEGNPYSDGKWRFGTFDFDYTSGLTYDANGFQGKEGYAFDSFQRMKNNSKYIAGAFANLLKNEKFRAQFITRYCDMANIVFEPQRMRALTEKFRTEYAAYIAESYVRWGSGGRSDYDTLLSGNQKQVANALTELDNFFKNRPNYTLDHMRNYIGITETLTTLTLNVKGVGTIEVNGLSLGDAPQNYNCKYPAGTLVTLTAVPKSGSKFTGWSGASSSKEASITVTLKEAMQLTAEFESSTASGDVNADGTTNIADVIAMQKWLLCIGDLKNSENGDLYADGVIDAYDLALLKRMVVS